MDGARTSKTVLGLRIHAVRERRQPCANPEDKIEPTGVFRAAKTETQHEKEIEAGSITPGAQTESTNRQTQEHEETIRCGDREENEHDADVVDAVVARRYGAAVVLAERRFEFERASSPVGNTG